MAGTGPAPARNKRRRGGTKVEQIDHKHFDIPELPKGYAITVWVEGEPKTRRLTYLPATRQWWEAWVRSPLAEEFAEVHWLRLLGVAKLKDRYERDPKPSNATELRLQEAAFGGTPADLRRAGKTVRPPEDLTENAGPLAPVVDAGSARRKRLQSVG